MIALPSLIEREKDNLTYEVVRSWFTHPSARLIANLKKLEGSIAAYGMGKLGPELVEMLHWADPSREIIAGSTFLSENDIPEFSGLGIEQRLREFDNGAIDVRKVNLLDPKDLAGLPDADNIVFMPGAKFGLDSDPNVAEAYRANVLLAKSVAERFAGKNIVILSSGAVYPLMPANGRGATELTPADPLVQYGRMVETREWMFRLEAKYTGSSLTHFRLNYSQHVTYGVLVDIALCIKEGRKINLDVTSYVTFIPQPDVNEAIINSLLLSSNLSKCKHPHESMDITLYPEIEQYGTIINIDGPRFSIREIAEYMAGIMGKEARFSGKEAVDAQLATDIRYRKATGIKHYCHTVDQMAEAAALWVKYGAPLLGKPTHFNDAKLVKRRPMYRT